MTGAHHTVLGPIAPIFEQDWSSGERRWMASRSKTWCAAIGLLLWASYPNGAPATENAVPKVAFFGFQLINTSLEPTTNGELHRLDMLDKLFRERLDTSGRFKIVPIPPDIYQRIVAGPEISRCNGCERDYAKSIGADWAAWGTVQKSVT
jgi:hypothetical protein